MKVRDLIQRALRARFKILAPFLTPIADLCHPDEASSASGRKDLGQRRERRRFRFLVGRRPSTVLPLSLLGRG